MIKPLVSVVVCCLNGEEYLPMCLDSLIKQSLNNIEIICVNDGSSDKSPDIIKNYIKQDGRIKLINNSGNLGLAESRNIGVKNAKADLIMFCDADDYFEEQACEEMYNAITKSKADLAICEIKVIYEAHSDMRYSDDCYYSLKYSGLKTINDEIVLNTDLSSANKIFRKKIIEKNQLRFPKGLFYEDAYFCPAYMCSCNTIYYLNEQLYNYVRHQKSIMSNTWSAETQKDSAIDHLYIAIQLLEYFKKNHLIKKYNQLYWKLFLSFEEFAIYNSKSKKRIKQVKAEARAFLKENAMLLEGADHGTIKAIKAINSSNLRVNKTAAKRFILRFLPTYRLESENVNDLRRLKNSLDQLSDRVDKLS